MGLPFFSALTGIFSLLAVASALLLLFFVVFSPNQALSSDYLSRLLTSLTLLLYSTLGFFATVPSAFPTQNLRAAQLLCLTLVSLSFYLALVQSLRFWSKTLKAFVLLSTSGLLVSLGLWLGNVFPEQHSTLALLVLGFALLDSLAAFVFATRVSQNLFSAFRLPSLVLGLAIMSFMLAPQVNLTLLFLTVFALYLCYWYFQRHYVLPLQTTHYELSRTQAELQSSLNELAQHKALVQQLQSDLSLSERYKNEFLGNISHELRTPLNAIIGYSELLISPIYGELNQQQHNRIDRIYRNGKHLLRLINAILEMTRIEAGQFQLQKSEFHVQSIIDIAMTKVHPIAQDKGIELDCEWLDHLPPLFADHQRIEQVIYHLLDNAVKFTQQGYVRLNAQVMSVRNQRADIIDLPTGQSLNDGQWMLMRIQDTGLGIANHDFERIFADFTQLDGSRTREFEGLGLGLSLSKRLVELHGGALWVESQLNEGSTFYLALPLVAEMVAVH